VWRGDATSAPTRWIFEALVYLDRIISIKPPRKGSVREGRGKQALPQTEGAEPYPTEKGTTLPYAPGDDSFQDISKSVNMGDLCNDVGRLLI